jgi:hypothetical protein
MDFEESSIAGLRWRLENVFKNGRSLLASGLLRRDLLTQGYGRIVVIPRTNGCVASIVDVPSVLLLASNTTTHGPAGCGSVT